MTKRATLTRVPTRKQHARTAASQWREQRVVTIPASEVRPGDRVQTRNRSGALIGDWRVVEVRLYALNVLGTEADVLHFFFATPGCSLYVRSDSPVEVVR